MTNLNLPNANVILIYRSPNESLLDEFLLALDHTISGSTKQVLIMGDLNIHLDILGTGSDETNKHNKSNANKLIQLLQIKHNMEQHITDAHTTDYGTLLDHIWSSKQMKLTAVGIGESYWTDHRPIWCMLPT